MPSSYGPACTDRTVNLKVVEFVLDVVEETLGEPPPPDDPVPPKGRGPPYNGDDTDIPWSLNQ